MESKQGRIALPWASVVITLFVIVSSFFIFLVTRMPFPAQESSMLHIDEIRGSFIPNEEKGDETMKLNVERFSKKKLDMERLILGKNMANFQAEGFACQTEQNSEQCITSNHVVIKSNRITIYVSKTPQKRKMIRPYALTDHASAMQMVTPLQILDGNLTNTSLPTCQYNHTVPAVVFSSGGYAVNTYHALDELLIPLFLTTRHFNSNVQFFVTDYDPRVIPKYQRFLRRLSKFEPIDSSSRNGTSSSSTHCFPGAIIGLNYHGNVVVNTSKVPTGYTMDDFRRFLYNSYNLNPSNLEILKPVIKDKPLLVLISRSKSRVILNMKQVVKLMEDVGYQVHVALDKEMSNLKRFSRLLSRSSVLVGTHGAGLSNSMFMPKGTVLLQVVPLGLRWGGIFCHGDPAVRMGLKYVEYLIEPKESSLSNSYAPDDPILVDTDSVLAKGYQEARHLYIDGQNVTINLNRFRGTLEQVFQVIRSPGQNRTQVSDNKN